MFKNIDISEINKNSVLRSVWVLLLSIISIAYLMLVLSDNQSNLFFISVSVFAKEMVLLWLLTFLICAGLCFVTEYVLIRQTTNQWGIIKIIGIETVLLIGANAIVNSSLSTETKFYCGIIFILGQFVRFLFLKWNNRMFNTANNENH